MLSCLLSKLTSLINQGEFIPSAWVNRSCIFNRPFECVVECYFNGVTHSGFERTKSNIFKVRKARLSSL
ncbi:hypothetical protein AZO1586R_1118 [Bathymodiolus azoricus thioautotrophic gill symbiont]|uniref:Uncharacterized protein n=1 Tax=Bathymodiolus azoricus thioautotrophic gill symbiont TaxID=235205 RepID=A0ACA8ZPY5_9GAMM|nr:hypothetical protein AZO1586R_1118 [Bathymodiolus azoricus thioautotrophic gill symbiont]